MFHQRKLVPLITATICFQKYGVSQEEIDVSLDKFSDDHAPGGVLDRATLNFQAENEAGEKIYVYYSDNERKAGVGIAPIRR
jgi:hypothetical protein